MEAGNRSPRSTLQQLQLQLQLQAQEAPNPRPTGAQKDEAASAMNPVAPPAVPRSPNRAPKPETYLAHEVNLLRHRELHGPSLGVRPSIQIHPCQSLSAPIQALILPPAPVPRHCHSPSHYRSFALYPCRGPNHACLLPGPRPTLHPSASVFHLRIGEDVVAAGHRLGERGTVGEDVVAARHRLGERGTVGDAETFYVGCKRFPAPTVTNYLSLRAKHSKLLESACQASQTT